MDTAVVSGWEILFGGDMVPDVDLAPLSDPLAEVAELGTAPALTELKEYTDETEARFDASWLAICDLLVESCGLEFFAKSKVLLAESLGRSASSTAQSSRGLGDPSDIEYCLEAAEEVLDFNAAS